MSSAAANRTSIGLQIFNGVTTTLVGGLLLFAVKKADYWNTTAIQLSQQQAALVEEVHGLKRDMVLRQEFRSEIERIERRIDDEEKRHR